MNQYDHPITRQSPPEAKISLFRSLFRGRDDVYPRRFESRKTGKSGYQPACSNEWARGLCDKRAVKCIDCLHRRFLAVTDETVRLHLSGKDETGRDFVMGLYPMSRDETCYCLAADFDKSTWREDVHAGIEVCLQLGLPPMLERSRSGNGGHLWWFFEKAIPAGLARKLGAHILTETMDRRPDIGLDSYDRFFPNQDTLPKGGFGNLIALPLQKYPREVGNSVFLDGQLNPHPDQWAFLSSVRKINQAEIETIVSAAISRDRVIGVPLVFDDEAVHTPWDLPPSRQRNDPPIADPLPASLELVLGNQIYIAKEGLPPGLRNRLLRLAAFQNPQFYKDQAMRLPTFDKPRIIACAEDHPLHIGLPRGCLDELRELLLDLKIKPVLSDKRFEGSPLNVKFHGELRPEQISAARALVTHDLGVLSATTAFGKTVLAAWLIAQRGVNTLVLVHRQQLLDQWRERLATFLGLPIKSIGQIGGGRKKPNGSLDVAIIQSLVRKGVVDDRVGNYGHLIVDECHHLSAFSFEQVARQAKAKYITGLSATVSRKDGHHPIILMQCGPVRYRVNAKQQAAARPFTHNVLVRPTSFRQPDSPNSDARMHFNELYDGLIANENRNLLICEDVIAAVREGRSPVVLTERTDHLDKLAEKLSPEIRHLVILRGGMGTKAPREIAARLAAIPLSEERVLLATGRYLGEGFDDARLDTLFLTLPVSWRGTIAQYAGRLHRLHEGKQEVRIYDYADLNVPMLARMFDRRCGGYESVGYTLLLPASAVPGWPTDVPLPIEPEWKRDYAASVQRLIRDGVDAHLGNLFVHASRTFSPDEKGIARARSATEAFLYQRLETLPETAGRFRLNINLPIPFDGCGCMEVDFLDQTTNLAIEIDGAQHLSDPATYRHDRRKDAFLQENGYFILRFLADDVGKKLDEVLDSILRTLTHRRKGK